MAHAPAEMVCMLDIDALNAVFIHIDGDARLPLWQTCKAFLAQRPVVQWYPIAVRSISSAMALLCGRGGDEIKLAAAMAVRDLVVTQDDAQTVVHAGVIPHLISLLSRGKSDAMKVVAIGALQNMAANAEAHEAIVRAGSIADIVRLLRGENTDEIKEAAAYLIANLAMNRNNLYAIRSSCATDVLLSLHDHTTIGQSAWRAISVALENIWSLTEKARIERCK